MKLDKTDPTKCTRCGKPHWLKDCDAGTDREMLRLCTPCFYRFKRMEEDGITEEDIHNTLYGDNQNDKLI